jgi:hypothetical protein
MAASSKKIVVFSVFPEVGMRALPLSAKTLPEDYKKLVLRADPSAREEDLVEAYLGYRTPAVPNYRCWCRMTVEEDAKRAPEASD